MQANVSILEISHQVRHRHSTAVQVVRAALDRIDSRNHELNAFRELTADAALSAADAIDLRIASGEDPGPLAGVPIAVKDNIATEFGHTTCCSRMLENYRSPFSATAVRRLMNAGAIIVGKTNCDEFAMGSSTEHSAFGHTKNPWDLTRVPGGSSGGSAVAVAANLTPVALGSETGGSIRQPASFCGVVGVKPSYGRVSRSGLVAFASSLDQIGPFARTVTDAATILSVMAGVDRQDSTSSPQPVPDYLASIEQPIRDLRIGIPRQYLNASNHAAVNDSIRHAVDVYRSLGAQIIDIDLPLTDFGIATYYVIVTAEASSNLARYDGIRYGHRATLQASDELADLFAKSRAEGFGPEVQRRVMLGTYVLSSGYYDAYYKRALQVRSLIKREFDAAFAKCHVLLGPVAPTPAFPIGVKTDPLSMYLADIYTVNTNLAGLCGISIPCGMAYEGGVKLPIGLHVQAQAFDEPTMFRAARMFEKATTHSPDSTLSA